MPSPVNSTPEETAPLSDVELQEVFRLHSPELVATLFAFIERTAAAEQGRQARLDGKATTLLAAAGVSLTIAFTFGGQFLANRNQALLNLGEAWHARAMLLTILACVTGMGASGFALHALFVRGYQALADRAVLNQEALANADEQKNGVTLYLRYLGVSVWRTVQIQVRNNNAKAASLRWAQLAYAAFLISVLLLAILGYVAMIAT